MYRVALGYDLHCMAAQKNSSIMCGGIEIPCDFVIKDAHSDGDVVLHALTDAFLSLCSTDIGQKFPNTDLLNYGRSSRDFILYANNQIEKYDVINIDIIVICDFPKIAPYTLEIACHIADLLSISAGDISIRGKTTENTQPLIIQAYTNVLFKKKGNY